MGLRLGTMKAVHHPENRVALKQAPKNECLRQKATMGQVLDSVKSRADRVAAAGVVRPSTEIGNRMELNIYVRV